MAKYLVNSGGILNSVPDEQFQTHMFVARQTAMSRQRPPDSALGQPDVPVTMPREATPDEIVAWWAAQGLVYDPETGEAHPKSAAPAPAKPEKPAK